MSWAALLTATGLAIAAADLLLLAICWRRRTVLGGVLGAAGIPAVAFAIVSGPTRSAGEDALLRAAIALAIGTALYAIGQVLQRLLDEEA